MNTHTANKQFPTLCTLAEFRHIIHAAGLWGSKTPGHTTLQRWCKAGLIIRRPGIRGRLMVDTAASLAKLRNPFAW